MGLNNGFGSGGGGGGGSGGMMMMMAFLGICCCCMFLLLGGGFYFYARPNIGISPTPPPPYPYDTTYVQDTAAPVAAAAPANGVYPSCGVTYNPAWESRETPPYDPNSCRQEMFVKDATCTQYQSVESPPGSGKWEWLRRGVVPGCTPRVAVAGATGWAHGGLPGRAGGGGGGGAASGGRQVINTGNASRGGSIFGPGGVFGRG